jgi:uncharacterized protein (DUF3084 family)
VEREQALAAREEGLTVGVARLEDSRGALARERAALDARARALEESRRKARALPRGGGREGGGLRVKVGC